MRNRLLTGCQLALAILFAFAIFSPITVNAASYTVSEESDWYFTLSEDATVIIYGNSNTSCANYVTGNQGTDPYLWLHNSSGTLVTKDDDSNHNQNDQCVSAKIYTTLTAGTYRLRAGYYPNQRGLGFTPYTDGRTWELVLDFDAWQGTTTTTSTTTTVAPTTSTSTTSTSTTTAPSTSTTTSTSTSSTSSTSTTTTSTTTTTTSTSTTTSTVPAPIVEPPPPPPPPPPTTIVTTTTLPPTTTTTSTTTTTTTTTLPPTTTTVTTTTTLPPTTTTSTTTTSSTTTTTITPTTTTTTTITPTTTTVTTTSVKPTPSTDAPRLAPEQIAQIADPEVQQAVTDIVTQPDEIVIDQIETVIEVIDELEPETVAVIADALTEAPDDVKEEFQQAVNIFDGAFDNYVPTGSTVDVATRRTVTAASVIISGVPTVTARRKT